jgi:hypothetical protein
MTINNGMTHMPPIKTGMGPMNGAPVSGKASTPRASARNQSGRIIIRLSGSK